MCKATGIGYSTISNWKRRRNLLSAKYAKLIADYFEVSLDYLMTGVMGEIEPSVMVTGKDYVLVDSGELMKLIDVVKDAPDDMLIRLRYYAEGLLAARKETQ